MNTFEYKNRKRKNYFEGWYLRVTDEEKNVNLAFIFAITKDEEDPHAFIQVYDGIALTNKYFRFDVNDFKYLDKTVYIKDNYLSLDNMCLKVKDFEINIMMENIVKINKKAESYTMEIVASSAWTLLSKWHRSGKEESPNELSKIYSSAFRSVYIALFGDSRSNGPTH